MQLNILIKMETRKARQHLIFPVPLARVDRWALRCWNCVRGYFFIILYQSHDELMLDWKKVLVFTTSMWLGVLDLYQRWGSFQELDQRFYNQIVCKFDLNFIIWAAIWIKSTPPISKSNQWIVYQYSMNCLSFISNLVSAFSDLVLANCLSTIRAIGFQRFSHSPTIND